MRVFITKEQVAYALGIDERTVTRYQSRVHDPLPVAVKGLNRHARSQYDLRAVAEWAVRQKLRQEEIDGDQALARLLFEKANNCELKNDQLRRELAPVGLLQLVLDRTGAGIAGILRKVPQHIRKRVPSLTAGEVEIIEKEIEKAARVAENLQPLLEQAVEEQKND